MKLKLIGEEKEYIEVGFWSFVKCSIIAGLGLYVIIIIGMLLFGLIKGLIRGIIAPI